MSLNNRQSAHSPYDKVRIITLMGRGQSREGFTFIFNKAEISCGECNLKNVCLKNLEEGRAYTIVKVRERTFPCEVHDEGVCVVEVVESDIKAALQAKMAYEGAIVNFEPPECEEVGCVFYDFCKPRGLLRGEKCKILKVDRSISCPLGSSLFQVLLRRIRDDRKTQ